MINLGDKKIRITLRLNQSTFDFVKSQADLFGVSPSEYVRMCLVTCRNLMIDDETNNKEDLGRENDKAHIDNKL